MPTMTPDQIRAYITAHFPELLAIIDKAGVWDALAYAAQNNQSNAQLQAALQNTPYYRSTTQADRGWDITTVIDPATAAQRLGEYAQQINNLASQTGIVLDPTTLTQLTKEAAANQWSSTLLRNNYVYAAHGIHTSGTTGENATDFNLVHQLASEYGVPISDQAAFLWADRLTAGSVDVNAVKGYMIEQAKSLYPGLAGALDQGITVAQYSDPYKQVAARELNINPNDFNLSDPKWSAALSQVDPKSGNKIPMSLDQWQTTVRTDPRYGYDHTLGAQSQASSLVTTLAKQFGAL